MNKVVFIGDIHGHDTWKRIVADNKTADHFVFVGDYFDAYLITPAVQIQNFKEIIEFKECTPDRVTLLMGNHDFHYTPYCKGRYGGYSHFFANEIGELLKANAHNLEMAWQYNNLLVTHAGLSSTWYDEKVEDKGHMFEIADKINQLWKVAPWEFNFSGPTRDGNSKDNSPLWIRPEALRSDPVDPDIIQIVGHTQRERISDADKVFVIDTLPREYLVLEDDEFIIKNVYSEPEYKWVN
mgnify:CR=1 FL=1